jgi:N-acetyl-gamma-glutamyl-phosphate reductase
MTQKIQLAIIGAAGLSGLELLTWLQRHPYAEVCHVTSDRYAGTPVGHLLASYRNTDLTFRTHDVDVSNCDVVFLAVPNQASMEWVPKLREQGLRVIDLSGMFRLQTPERTAAFYGDLRPDLRWFEEAVFGLSEVFAEDISDAQLLANPGCYPTGALLALLPLGEWLLQLERAPIIDAKSGVSGAGGRVENATTNYVDVNENLKPYKIFHHQHRPEIQLYLADAGYTEEALGDVIFTPHLLPVNRGILSTIYLRFKEPVSAETLREKYTQFCAGKAFVHLLESGQTPDLNAVAHSNHCVMNLFGSENGQDWIVVSAIDNLVKGAAGQALQNMNLMFGVPETTGLL